MMHCKLANENLLVSACQNNVFISKDAGELRFIVLRSVKTMASACIFLPLSNM
jgi:hypothetical protein